MVESYDNIWQQICASLFIKSPSWYGTVQSLPEELNSEIVLRRTISAETLVSLGVRAQAWVGSGVREEVKSPFVTPEDFPLSPLLWAYLQFSAQFFIMEGLFNLLSHQGAIAPELWPKGILEEFSEITQTMAFYASMVIIAEENRLPADENDVVPLVRQEIRKIVNVLTSKTTDYGQAFLRHGVLGLLHRVWDKIARYATLSAENRAAKFESRKDTATDMLGYSVLIWSILADIKASQPIADKVLPVTQ